MRWIFSFLYEYITMPKEVGDGAHQTRRARSRLLVFVLIVSLMLNGWIIWKIVLISGNHVKAVNRIKVLETVIDEKEECSAKLQEAQNYLKLCMAPGRR